jgi:hypothetical protein
MQMQIGQRVRFKNRSRYGDWNKNDEGVINEVLVLPPQNQSAIYIVNMFIDGAGEVQTWATDEDIEPWDQLSLF